MKRKRTSIKDFLASKKAKKAAASVKKQVAIFKTQRGKTSTRKRRLKKGVWTKMKVMPKTKSQLTKYIRSTLHNEDPSEYRKIMYGNCNFGTLYNAGTRINSTYGDKCYYEGYEKSGTSTTYSTRGCSFIANSPQQLQDALSVMYTDRAPRYSYDDNTATPNTLLPLSTKFNIVYASWTWMLKNITTQAYGVKIHKFRSKDVHGFNVLTDFENSITAHKWKGAPVRTIGASAFEMIAEQALKISDVKLKHWNHVSTRYSFFKPGDTLSFSTSIANKDIDFEKGQLGSGTTLSSYMPGSETFVLEVVKAPVVNYISAGNSTACPPPAFNGEEVTISVTCKQYYRLSEPDNIADAYEGRKTCLFTDAATNLGAGTIVYNDYQAQNDTRYQVTDIRG